MRRNLAGRTGAIGVLALLWASCSGPAQAQTFTFSPPEASRTDALSGSIAALAQSVIAAAPADDRIRDSDTLFRLQMVAGRDAEALRGLVDLERRRAASGDPGLSAKDLQYEIVLNARIQAAQDHLPFETAFARAFRARLATLDDRTSALLIRAMSPYSSGISLHAPIEETLSASLGKQKGKTDISLPDAIALLRAYQVASAYRVFAPLLAPLAAEDDQRRYRIEQTRVPTGGGASVCALVVRQRSATGPLPALLEFTVYADPPTLLSEARRSASNGYIGVEGTSRGKICSEGPVTPYEYDGADAATLIDWISHQPWSDGRVGMFGASYNGFTTWAAMKHRPPALKAVMDSVTNIPGVDSPMEGGATLSFNYYWPFYVAANTTLDDAPADDGGHWRSLFRDWYRGGGAYGAMDKLDGRPNPIWDRWLAHPDYDAYWQAMVPFGPEFTAIDIPILTTTGYYDGGEVGALYALGEHERFNPKAEHYLVIGPYDHHGGNRGTVDVLGDHHDNLDGYVIDPAARIDMGELRYDWFDYTLKGGPRPQVLQDRINYEVMGANLWKHAPSLAAMSGGSLRLHFGGEGAQGAYALIPKASGGHRGVTQTLDLADRSDADRTSPAQGGIVDTVLDPYESLVFESAPFDRSAELSGLFSGRLAFVTNKRDFDFQVQLYEHTAQGQYITLSYYSARASYVRDRTRRQLLAPGKPETLDFTAGRLTSRRLAPGSRLVVQLSLVKSPFAEINYGSGKAVSEETVADAGPPLEIRWSQASYIDLPIRP